MQPEVRNGLVIGATALAVVLGALVVIPLHVVLGVVGASIAWFGFSGLAWGGPPCGGVGAVGALCVLGQVASLALAVRRRDRPLAAAGILGLGLVGAVVVDGLVLGSGAALACIPGFVFVQPW